MVVMTSHLCNMSSLCIQALVTECCMQKQAAPRKVCIHISGNVGMGGHERRSLSCGRFVVSVKETTLHLRGGVE